MIRWLFFLLLVSNTLFAQSNNHSLLLQYKDSVQSSPVVKSYWYNQIAYNYNLLRKYDSAKVYLYLAVHSELKDIPDQKAFIYSNLGTAHYSSQIDSSMFYYQKAKEIYLQIKDTINLALMSANLGKVYNELGVYDRALENLLEATLFFEQTNDLRNLASCYNTIASIYSKQGDYDKALNYHHLALKLRKSLNIPRQISATYNNLGILFKKIGLYDSTLVYYKKSLEIKRHTNDYLGLGVAMNNLGSLYLEIDNYDSAHHYLTQALHWRKEANDKTGTSITLNNLGRLYVLNNMPKIGLKYLLQANEELKNLKLLEELKDNLENLILAYEAMNLQSEALSISKSLMAVKDSLLNQEKIESLIEMQIKYETEKKIREIALLEEKQKVQEAQLEIRQIWIFTLVLIAFLLLIIGLLIYTRWNKEKAAKHAVETLMQELHHRVKNNLQLLSSIFSLQSRAIRDENALEAVKSGENRVNAMAIIHQKLYRKTGSRLVNINEYITDLVDELAASYGYNNDNATIKTSIEPLNLDVDKVIPLGLIVNELVSNSLKYAFPVSSKPYLEVVISEENALLTLNISDNGPGFQSESISKNSMGLNIIRTLGRQLKASICWETNNKTSFTLTLNLPPYGKNKNTYR
ncbi:tetratricopeptide repeat protein [Fulvivirga sediminis]|uniref:histidine kinase n=1 Tax=Fulvivirga sediminis TaxID=2803949 RepID=A0A937F6L0_9BACT|nr:tetratricopeptide repeat protein [Fulvivirga sediminis]MBL3657377.1 tetratricopeptide repeat protein [Fulvivirga sediminis]